MFYTIDYSTEINIIGTQFPQVQSMIKGYDYNGENSIYRLAKCYKDLPNFDPNLNGFVLHSKAKYTDFISNALTNQGFIVSQKVKDILSQFHLPLHFFYPIKLYQKNQEITNYYWLHIISDLTDIVNYKKSSFFIYKDYTYNLGKVDITSKDDFIIKRNEIKKMNPQHTITLWANSIFLLNKPEYDFFKISTFDTNWYVNAAIQDEFEKQQVNGITILPADSISYM